MEVHEPQATCGTHKLLKICTYGNQWLLKHSQYGLNGYTTLAGSEPFQYNNIKDHHVYLMETKYGQHLGKVEIRHIYIYTVQISDSSTTDSVGGGVKKFSTAW